MPLRSACEVMAALEIASNLKLAKKDIIEARLHDADELSAMITGFIKKLTSELNTPLLEARAESYENYEQKGSF